jgi:hypothetical protein
LVRLYPEPASASLFEDNLLSFLLGSFKSNQIKINVFNNQAMNTYMNTNNYVFVQINTTPPTFLRIYTQVTGSDYVLDYMSKAVIEWTKKEQIA